MGALPSGAQEQIGQTWRSRAPDGSAPYFYSLTRFYITYQTINKIGPYLYERTFLTFLTKKYFRREMSCGRPGRDLTINIQYNSIHQLILLIK